MKKTKKHETGSVSQENMEPRMTPDHSQWRAFCDELAEAVAANGCSSTGHENALRLLGKYGVNVEKSIEFFRKNSGFCDCEILMNVECQYDAPLWVPDKEVHLRQAVCAALRDKQPLEDLVAELRKLHSEISELPWRI